VALESRNLATPTARGKRSSSTDTSRGRRKTTAQHERDNYRLPDPPPTFPSPTEQPSQRRASRWDGMGSAGALLSHPLPQLHPGGVLISQSRPLHSARNLPLLSLAAAAPGLQRGRCRRLCCASVNGEGGQREAGPPPQMEKSPSSGLGAALEDPPPGPPGTSLVTPFWFALPWYFAGAPRDSGHMLNK
jgi:hypothetical protein